MIRIVKADSIEAIPNSLDQAQIVEFLHTHLDRFRDDKAAISKAIDYAFSDQAGKGGYLLLAFDNERLAGALVMNKTGMQDFIPENILVYIAVDADYRGKGIGTAILREAFETSEGGIALHVEYDNPAKALYERLGFSTKYAEMRWHKGS